MINGELVVDNFAGGGGASTGIEMATGYSVDIAINHDLEAIRMHKANHPYTKHYCEDVWQVDPVKACNGYDKSVPEIQNEKIVFTSLSYHRSLFKETDRMHLRK